MEGEDARFWHKEADRLQEQNLQIRGKVETLTDYAETMRQEACKVGEECEEQRRIAARLRTRCAVLRAALEEYADRDNWSLPGVPGIDKKELWAGTDGDGWEIADEALKPEESSDGGKE